jgi:hypothetical protein
VFAAAELIREDAEALDALAQGEPFTAGNLRALPRPIASRVVRRECARFGVVPERVHVAAVLGLCESKNPRACAHLPGGLRARRNFDSLTITTEGTAQ